MKREYSDIGGIQQQAADIIRQAYDKGYKAGYVDGKDEAYKNPVPTQDAYNDGLRDAWECARKIVTMDWSIMDDKCGIDFKYYCFTAYSASEAIAKIKEYEEQQKQADDEIKVGDEVIGGRKKKGYVTRIDSDCVYVIYHDGTVGYSTKTFYTKTGRHFPQLAEVLDQMKGSEQDGKDT